MTFLLQIRNMTKIFQPPSPTPAEEQKNRWRFTSGFYSTFALMDAFTGPDP